MVRELLLIIFLLQPIQFSCLICPLLILDLILVPDILLDILQDLILVLDFLLDTLQGLILALVFLLDMVCIFFFYSFNEKIL